MELLNNNSKENGGNGMNGVNDFGVSDILTGRGLGLGGFGYGYGNMGVGCNAGYGSPYANLATIQHGINHAEISSHNDATCNREVYTQGLNNALGRLDQLQADNKFENTNTNMSNGFNRICDKLVADNTSNLIRSAENNLNMFREMASIRAEAKDCCCETQKAIAEAAKEAAKCCCEAQLRAAENQAALLLKMCEDKNETLVAMAAGFTAIKDRELNAANARITQLETINAINNHHHN